LDGLVMTTPKVIAEPSTSDLASEFGT